MSVVENAKEQLLSSGSWLVDPAHSTVEFRVTRPIDLDGELHSIVIDADGRERIALALRGQLDRSDYGLVWNRALETGNLVVGDTVDLVLDVAAVRAG
jgi:polyisoprenoid-binding protein YceI